MILQKVPKDLRCPSRSWKVNLVGEGADDAGGVFDETIAQMCEVRIKWVEHCMCKDEDNEMMILCLFFLFYLGCNFFFFFFFPFSLRS